METTAYVLGMLTIVMISIISVIVVGIVKIVKLQKQINNLTETLYRDSEHTHRRIEDIHSDIWRQFEKTGRDVTMVEQTIMNRIDKTRQEMDQAIDQLHRIDAELNENARRYTDSRIDKLIDTYFSMQSSPKSKKQLND